ncbi:lipopolysaccharide transport periplasmic protein LptA [Dechloromonas sp. ZY10]|uniref:lipopolysaccharide transport periplasmic protein LptA n=1 Tax=Dechloromonas aquae TaxID=2664436 RepID=UPI003527EC5F
MKLRPLCLLLATLGSLLAASTGHAERADRDKPMLLEANRVTIDDAKKQQILEGDVVLTKGTLVLKAERIVVSEDAYGFQKGIAFGSRNGLARFRQKREGRDEYVEGQAERIEYSSRDEIAELFHRAWVRSGEDEIKGDYIWYDAIGEKYMATIGDRKTPGTPAARVRAVIQPRNKSMPEELTAAPTPRSDSLQLRGANSITPPAPTLAE